MSFSSLPLRPELLAFLTRFERMSPIQSRTLPLILAGDDLIAHAPTGSGKTLAFALGALHHLDPQRWQVQSLILCPTRELAEQVADVIRACASEIGNIKVLTLCGGVPMRAQRHSLRHGAHIVVGTPGRILKLLELGDLNADALRGYVLDEADRMVDMGFVEDMEAIGAYLPTPKQTLLFSATYPDSIQEIAQRFAPNAHFIGAHQEPPMIEEIAYHVTDKITALKQILTHHALPHAIVFCNTKAVAMELDERLRSEAIHAITLHGDMEQLDRTEAMIQFRNGSVTLLIATDVAGRGIDIEGLECIINYDLPQHPERYIHRIGRTGRAGSKGLAITLISPHQSLDGLNRSIDIHTLPAQWDETHTSALMQTLCIDAGKKEKLRKGDIVGFVVHEGKIAASDLGRIDQLDHLSYIALPRAAAAHLYATCNRRPIKGRRWRMWLLD